MALTLGSCGEAEPVEVTRITSSFGRRFHPILKRWRSHNGVDYAANTGTPVWATADGTVTHRGVKGSYGNMVEIRHANGFVTRYAHCSALKKTVGSRVKRGETIALMGNTGRQFTDRGKLGGPQRLGFMTFFLGHVPGHQQRGFI